jgi:hypothetical protein
MFEVVNCGVGEVTSCGFRKTSITFRGLTIENLLLPQSTIVCMS